MADPGHRAGHGDGQAEAAAGGGRPAAAAEPPPARGDLGDAARLGSGGRRESGLLGRAEGAPQRVGVQVVHDRSPPIVEARIVEALSRALSSSADTRSFASARELVDFTVPAEMPRSRATA